MITKIRVGSVIFINNRNHIVIKVTDNFIDCINPNYKGTIYFTFWMDFDVVVY